MKSTLITGIVIVAILAVVALKLWTKESGTSAPPSCCPCSMIESAQSNDTQTGTASVE